MHDASIVIRAVIHGLRVLQLVKVIPRFGIDVVPQDINELVPVQCKVPYLAALDLSDMTSVNLCGHQLVSVCISLLRKLVAVSYQAAWHLIFKCCEEALIVPVRPCLLMVDTEGV